MTASSIHSVRAPISKTLVVQLIHFRGYDTTMIPILSHLMLEYLYFTGIEIEHFFDCLTFDFY